MSQNQILFLPPHEQKYNILETCRLGAAAAKRNFVLFTSTKPTEERVTVNWSGESLPTKIAVAFLSFPDFEWLWTDTLFIVFEKKLTAEVLHQLSAFPRFQYHDGLETALVHTTITRIILWMVALHRVNAIFTPGPFAQKILLKMRPDEKLSLFLQDLKSLLPNIKQSINNDEIHFTGQTQKPQYNTSPVCLKGSECFAGYDKAPVSPDDDIRRPAN